MLHVLFCLFFATASAQTTVSDATLLSELPHGTRIRILQDIPLGLTVDEQHQEEMHFCTFEDGDCTIDFEAGVFPSLHSQLNLRTDIKTALRLVQENIVFNDDFALRAGTYCLNRDESRFRSSEKQHTDKLRFTDCAGTTVFTIYTNAGYGLRNQNGFRGFTVSEFNFHGGGFLRIEK